MISLDFSVLFMESIFFEVMFNKLDFRKMRRGVWVDGVRCGEHLKIMYKDVFIVEGRHIFKLQMNY